MKTIRSLSDFSIIGWIKKGQPSLQPAKESR